MAQRNYSKELTSVVISFWKLADDAAIRKCIKEMNDSFSCGSREALTPRGLVGSLQFFFMENRVGQWTPSFTYNGMGLLKD